MSQFLEDGTRVKKQLKQSHHLLQLFSRKLQRCFAVNLQKCFVDYKTKPDLLWGWVDMTEFSQKMNYSFKRCDVMWFNTASNSLSADSIPPITKDTAREAFALFASSKCCYSSGPAKDGVITGMEAFNTYRVRGGLIMCVFGKPARKAGLIFQSVDIIACKIVLVADHSI